MPINNTTAIKMKAITTDAAILRTKTDTGASFSCFRSYISTSNHVPIGLSISILFASIGHQSNADNHSNRANNVNSTYSFTEDKMRQYNNEEYAPSGKYGIGNAQLDVLKSFGEEQDVNATENQPGCKYHRP
jgi:hypothetical protein